MIDINHIALYIGSVKNLTDEFLLFSQNIPFCPV